MLIYVLAFKNMYHSVSFYIGLVCKVKRYKAKIKIFKLILKSPLSWKQVQGTRLNIYFYWRVDYYLFSVSSHKFRVASRYI